MITINGNNYSGSIIRNDESVLVISIYTLLTLPDLCIAMNDVSEVSETDISGNTTVYAVYRTSEISNTRESTFTIVFQKGKPMIEEMNDAIDALLVMVLEG